MARRPPNGHDPVQQQMLDVLIRMDGRLASMDERLASIDERLGHVELRLERVELRLERLEMHAVATTKELENLGKRIDNILTGELGKSVRDHGDRILRLEEDVAALRGKPHVQ